MSVEQLLGQLQADGPVLGALRDRAARDPCTILLAEPDDERILEAAVVLQETQLARPLLLGRVPRRGQAARLGARLPEQNFWDPALPARRQEAAELLWRRRRARGLSQGQAMVLATQPLYQAAALLALGEADALVAGASMPTAEVVRAALWAIGVAPGAGTVSGAFLMVSPEPGARPLLMADCAAVPVPRMDQLVDIGRATGRSFERLFGRSPAVAFLSFSTGGSATHPGPRSVAQAAGKLSAYCPEWRVVGEVQADAALVPEIARGKGIDWGQAGSADVLIFPDLNSGNIGTKLVERLGRWHAIGPFLQGLRRPVCDLSRGCAAKDVVDAAAVITLLAAGRQRPSASQGA